MESPHEHHVRTILFVGAYGQLDRVLDLRSEGSIASAGHV